MTMVAVGFPPGADGAFRVNVAACHADDAISACTQQINDRHELRVCSLGGHCGLIEILERIHTFQYAGIHRLPAGSLDLIAHGSTFVLGRWDVGRSAPAEVRELGELRMLDVRLLGCGTVSARTSDAYNSLRAGFDSRIKIWGTVGALAAPHFCETGIDPKYSTLVDLGHEHPARGKPLGEIAEQMGWFDALPKLPTFIAQDCMASPLAESATTIVGRSFAIARGLRWNAFRYDRDWTQLLPDLDGSPAYAPGFLAEPDFELAIPAADGTSYHRISVLCDGVLARLYPASCPEGVVFRVKKEKQASLVALQSALAGMELTHLNPVA